jgi:metal-responsive CopG/Arc/MetJ family transcriptional regulator
MSTLYRTQLLLESEQHQALAEIAQREGRSISELVREILREHLVERDQKARKEQELRALEGLTRIRERLQQQYGVYRGDLLGEARAEREEEIERTWLGEA